MSSLIDILSWPGEKFHKVDVLIEFKNHNNLPIYSCNLYHENGHICCTLDMTVIVLRNIVTYS